MRFPHGCVQRNGPGRSRTCAAREQSASGQPYAAGTLRDIFSDRVGCQIFQPVLRMDLAALCLRR
jgi:hypothetical protein